MSKLDTVIQDLVIANRILAKEEVVDAYGHISIRHPDDPKRFFISRSVAPDLVERGDIVELGLDGQPVRDETRSLYLERFIHAAIYEARPDVNSVVHAHAEDTLPFGVAQATPLKPVIHSGSFIGATVPVWDIADKFGDTNLLVTNMEQGRDLAKCLANNNVALMRGHGFASAGRSLIEVVRMSVYLPRNARALLRAKQLGGEVKYLSQGEIAARSHAHQARRRAWAQPQEMNAATARPISHGLRGWDSGTPRLTSCSDVTYAVPAGSVSASRWKLDQQ
jgi:ribulose-5-phosphate 4-epimerase/fuculose-1-phosphate aldolase